MDDRRPDTVIDTAINREIRELLAVDPSREFLARVRTQIANEPATEQFPWAWASAAVIAVVVVAVAVALVPWRSDSMAEVGATEAMAATADLKVSTTEGTPTTADLEVSATASVVVPTFRSAKRPSVTHESIPAELDVLISPADALAFQQFVESTRSRSFEIVVQEPSSGTTIDTVTELSIPPLVIEPLDPPPANN